MNYCNVIVTREGLIEENILIIGDEKGSSVGAKAEEILVEKAKQYATSGLAWDDDIENEMIDNGYINHGEFSVMISWPNINKI